MPQCQALTKQGRRCRREALTDSRLCSFHVDYTGELAVDEKPQPAPRQEPVGGISGQATIGVEVRPSGGVIGLRYTGRGTYFVGGHEFSPSNREALVPWDVYNHLINGPYFEPLDGGGA